LIAVIAALAVIDSTVAAGFNPADSVAAVARVLITVITKLKPFANDPITAARQRAVAAACVGVDLVAVVTGFIPCVAFSDVQALDPIAAASRLAARRAAVVIGDVTVVAGFALIDSTVAASLCAATARATVAVVVVAVVAFLEAFILGRKVAAPDVVAAAGDFAAGGARVGRVGVAVVARFLVVPNDAISASRRRAGVETLIGVDDVAVITALTVLNHAITAADRLTRVAVVRGVVVAVVAALSRADHAVAAARLKAAGQAGVGVDLVAVIASFKTNITFDEVVSDHAVTAAG
jgi:hypothetical protein